MHKNYIFVQKNNFKKYVRLSYLKFSDRFPKHTYFYLAWPKPVFCAFQSICSSDTYLLDHSTTVLPGLTWPPFLPFIP